MQWSDLRTLTALTRREFQLGLRTPFFWALLTLGGLYALWRALTSDGSLALSCYQVVQFAVIGLGVAGVLLGGTTAGRDARDRAQELVLSKPMGNRPLVVAARFLGAWLSLLAVVAAMLLVVAVGLLASGGHAWGPATYGNALARALVPLALAMAVGFTLTTLYTTPLAAAIAGIYWVAVPLAQAHLPAVFDMTLTQHWPMAALFALGLLALSGWRYGRAVAGVSRRPLGVSSALLFAAAILMALALVSQGDDALARPSPILSVMSGQSAQQRARAPGFWLPDARGRLVGLEDLGERPTVLVFWSPSEGGSTRLLRGLGSLARDYRSEGLACVVICADRDSATLAPFAREVGGGVVMLRDVGRHFATGRNTLDSALVTAYMVEQSPTAFLLDRERLLEQTLPACGFDELAREVAARRER